jgi:hypothetical protein
VFQNLVIGIWDLIGIWGLVIGTSSAARRNCHAPVLSISSRGLRIQSEMSQYPSPYYPPNVQPPYLPYGGPADVLAPARRASTMMFILGGLLMMLGSCNIIQWFVVPFDQQLERFHHMQNMPAGADSMQLGDDVFKACLIGVPILFVVLGGLFITFAVGVRRGGRISSILALVQTSIILAVLMLFALLMLIAAIQTPLALLFAGMLLIPLGLLIPLTVWLIATLRVLPRLATAQQQYLAQYWQYQQNMQAYSGYGYAAPPQEGQPYAPQNSPPPSPPPLPARQDSPPPAGG